MRKLNLTERMLKKRVSFVVSVGGPGNARIVSEVRRMVAAVPKTEEIRVSFRGRGRDREAVISHPLWSQSRLSFPNLCAEILSSVAEINSASR